jgi:hypothetical protein
MTRQYRDANGSVSLMPYAQTERQLYLVEMSDRQGARIAWAYGATPEAALDQAARQAINQAWVYSDGAWVSTADRLVDLTAARAALLAA